MTTAFSRCKTCPYCRIRNIEEWQIMCKMCENAGKVEEDAIDDVMDETNKKFEDD